LGSTAKGAMADCIWGLYTKRGEATLAVRGRDLPDEYDLAVRFDRENGSWESQGDARQVHATSAQQRVLDALEAMGGTGTTTQVADHTGMDRGNASRALSDLANAGKVRRGEREGREVPYTVVPEQS